VFDAAQRLLRRAAEAGQVLVAGLGLELGRAATGLGQVLQGAVAQLVERPAFLVRVELAAAAFQCSITVA
jgi:hypothetical protein